MRLHSITLENLNSLYGRHHVDVDNDLGGAPLFVIVGPTGAGKSTLLDAVSLALFGETPRLRNSRGRSTSTGGDARLVMSRGTASCFAAVEVSLPTSTGRARYRAAWAARRARGDAEGRLQTVRRQLERQDEDGTWQTLVASDLKKIWEPAFRSVFADLDADTFRRTMLLPQGEFAALLKADVATKAGLLERLTDTAAFAEVGARASAMKRAADERLAATHAELQRACDVTPEQATAIERDLAAARATAAKLNTEVERLSALRAWQDRRRKLQSECEAAASELARAVAAVDAHSADAARLASHREVDAAAEAAHTYRQLHTSEQVLAAQLATVSAELLQTKAAADAALTRRDLAASELAQRQQAREALEPALEEARLARANVEARRAELAAHLERRAAAVARTERATAEQVAAQGRRDACQRNLASTQAQLAEFDGLDALSDALSGIQARVERVGRLAPRVVEADESVAQLLMAQEAATQQAARARDGVTDRHALEAELRGDQQRLRTTLRAALPQGVDLGAWRETHDAVLQRRRANLSRYQRATGLADERRRAADEAASARVSLQASDAAAGAAAEHEAALSATDQETQRQLQLAQARLEELSFSVELIARRAILVDDDPCPLCGSEQHPYRVDASLLAEHDAALVARHHERTAEVEQLSARRVGLVQELTTTAAQRERAEATSETLRAQCRVLEERVVALNEAMTALVGSEHHASPPDTWRQAQRASEHYIVRDTRLRRFVDGVSDRLTAASARVQEAAGQTAKATAELDDVTARLTTLELRHRELTKSRAQLSAELDDAMAAIRDAFHNAGIEVGDGVTECIEAIAEAQRRIETHRALTTHLATLRDNDQALAAHVAATQAVREASESDLAELSAVAAHQTGLLATAQATAEQMLGGQCPEALATAAGQELTRLRAALDRAAADVERAGAAAAALGGQQQILGERALELAAAVSASKVQLDAILAASGLPDTDALNLVRLDDDEAARLVVAEESRAQARRSATIRLETLMEMQEGHLATCPPGDDPSRRELDTAALMEQARTALDASNRKLGALTAEDERIRVALASRRDVRSRWERARADAATWQRLHKLIGTGEGRAFQEFAQTLNLHELTARANVHLQQLHSRFELTVARNSSGQAELDFAIIDNAQGRKVRPVTTLSGGETFLVSLALALGLSDLSNRGFPIETLLLDEGFGALDAAALDDVLAVLEQLRHARHVQVGLISHVDAVRERVGARVIIEPRGDGRSTVRVDHVAPMG